MPEINELYDAIDQLNEQINDWETDIEVLQENIQNAREEIQVKEAEIQRLEAEAQRSTLVEQLTAALSEMSVEQLTNLVSSLQGGDTPTVEPAPIADHPTVMPESPRFTTVDTRMGEIAIEVPEDRPESWCISLDECNDGVNLTVDEMATADMTIVGVRHQDLLTVHHYVPKIGELVRLEKETETSNCFGVLIASDVNELEEDMAIGVLPAEGGSKADELVMNDFPCVCHQEMWNNPDLDELYEVTGVLVGRYVTIRKVHVVEEGSEEAIEIEEESSSTASVGTSLNVLRGVANTVREAQEVFEAEMPDYCTLDHIEDYYDGFVAHYYNHRENHMDRMAQAVIIQKEE